jgi:hypothetical protein
MTAGARLRVNAMIVATAKAAADDFLLITFSSLSLRGLLGKQAEETIVTGET